MMDILYLTGGFVSGLLWTVIWFAFVHDVLFPDSLHLKFSMPSIFAGLMFVLAATVTTYAGVIILFPM